MMLTIWVNDIYLGVCSEVGQQEAHEELKTKYSMPFGILLDHDQRKIFWFSGEIQFLGYD